ncbi:hypothetical protein Tco_0100251 [Tanacetum coccineum]
MSMSIRSSVTDKILVAQGEASKVENATVEMLRGLDQQMEKKEDGGLYFIDRDGISLIGDFLALEWHLEEIHVTWANLEKKRTRLRTYTKSLEDLCIQCVETVSQA